jgi:hypothetical protein
MIEGTGVTTCKEVLVTQLAGKGCKVKGGTITTNTLKGTSVGMEGNWNLPLGRSSQSPRSKAAASRP